MADILIIIGSGKNLLDATGEGVSRDQELDPVFLTRISWTSPSSPPHTLLHNYQGTEGTFANGGILGALALTTWSHLASPIRTGIHLSVPDVMGA